MHWLEILNDVISPMQVVTDPWEKLMGKVISEGGRARFELLCNTMEIVDPKHKLSFMERANRAYEKLKEDK